MLQKGWTRKSFYFFLLGFCKKNKKLGANSLVRALAHLP
jgi:hypothetical protein